MGKQKLHLHSMMVHIIAALAPIAALSLVLFLLEIRIGSFKTETWRFLTDLSVVIMLIIAIPSVLSGVFERGHIYVKWHTSHKQKLVISFALLLALAIEFAMLLQKGHFVSDPTVFALFVIAINNILVFLLCYYGMRITLGRQSIAKTSYIPDMKMDPPYDILTLAGENRHEEAKYYDLFKEK